MLALRCLLCFIAVALTVVSAPAVATTKRTFVASIGTDNPACSIAAPCRTFAAAMAATSANGEVIVLDSGGYGSVTITQSVSIIAPPGVYAGISVFAGFNGIDINAPGATVVLRGLSINGQGGANGILSQAAARVRVENCVVSNMGAVGIYHQADGGEMIVQDTIVRDNHDGIGLVASSASIALDRVSSEHNAVAGFYMAPTASLSPVRATIAGGLFAHNGWYGIWADSVGDSSTFIVVERSVFSYNGVGYYATAAAGGAYIEGILSRNTFSHSSFSVRIVAPPPGDAVTYLSENAFLGSEVQGDGDGSSIYASRNSGRTSMYCANGGTFVTFGNNDVETAGAGSCTKTISGGK